VHQVGGRILGVPSAVVEADLVAQAVVAKEQVDALALALKAVGL